MIDYDSTNVVDEVGKLNFEGNIIPHSWYKTVIKTTAKGFNKPDTVGIILLSDILYWYRPTIIRDEATGAIVKVKKKFKADKLQRSYDQLSEQFGFSKRQVRDAIHRLKDLGLITIEFRSLKVNGLDIHNVLYIEPIPENVSKATFSSTPYEKKYPMVQKNVIGGTKNRGTNTEITTENTTEIETVDGKPPSSVLNEDQDLAKDIKEDYEMGFAPIADVHLGHLARESKHKRERPSLEYVVESGCKKEKSPVPKNKGGEGVIKKGAENNFSKVKSSPKNSKAIITHFKDMFKEYFKGSPPITLGKDAKLVKTLLEAYDYDIVLNMVDYMFENWAKFSRETKLKTAIPTIGILWGFKDYLYGQIMYTLKTDEEQDSLW